jgi:predicted nucleic acid-binding protein
MTYLPDVNVWIALAAERHTLHRKARQWFRSLKDERLEFCRLTRLGFLRLLTNKRAAGLTLVTFDAKIRPTEDVSCLLLGGAD